MGDVSLLQSSSYVAAAIGVCIAAVYYVMMLREQRKNMKTTLETRQIQILLDLAQLPTSYEGQKRFADWMNMTWTDYEDFEKRYDSDINVDNYALRYSMGYWFEKMGFLLRYGMITSKQLWDLSLGEPVLQAWSKFREINLKQREGYHLPHLWSNWEYLYDEIAKIATQMKHGIEYEEIPFSYADSLKLKDGAH